MDKNEIQRIIIEGLFLGLTQSKKLGMSFDFNIKSVDIENKAILIKFEPRFLNKVALLGEITAAMAFVSHAIGEDCFGLDINHIGIQAEKNSKILIRVISSIKEAKKSGTGEVISWIKNSQVDDLTEAIHKVIFLVEGETELTAFPMIFKSQGVDLKSHIIEIVPFSNENLKSMLFISRHYKNIFFVLFDKDKTSEVNDLKKENLLKDNEYHILSLGEFEDYISSDILSEALNDFDPGLNASYEYIENERKKGKRTTKIIEEYYYKSGETYIKPPKPILGGIVTQKMIKYEKIPNELKEIVKKIMAL